jgi:hypothetical protein
LFVSTAHSCGVIRPKKLCGCVVQPAGPRGGEAVDQPRQALAFVVQLPLVGHHQAGAVGVLRRMGSSLRMASRLMSGSMSPGSWVRGGGMFGAARCARVGNALDRSRFYPMVPGSR